MTPVEGLEGEPQTETKKVGKRTYLYDCEFCKSKQVWVNMGQFSQCEGCKVVGTHAGDLECGCGEYDFLYTLNYTTDQNDESFNGGEAKCSVCTLKLFETI